MAGDRLTELASVISNPGHVRDALWTMHKMIIEGSSTVYQRMVILTCDPNPAGTSSTADTHRHAQHFTCSNCDFLFGWRAGKQRAGSPCMSHDSS